MNRSIGVCLLLLVFYQAAAYADIIESKTDGIMNGSIVSENDKEVKFRDAKGKEHVYPKADVLYVEKEDMGKIMQHKTNRILEYLKNLPAKLRSGSDKATQAVVRPMSKPLDRSMANAKSDMLAKVLDESSKAGAASGNKIKEFNREVYRQKHEAEEESAPREEKKGRFASLED